MSRGMDIARAEDAVRASRNAMDASSFGGRCRTAQLQGDLDRLRAQEARPGEVVHTVVMSARQQGKTHALRIKRVRAVAKGATINGTYRLSPEPALEAFRADLLALVGNE